MRRKFLNIGWKSKISQKRVTFSISINKMVVIGCNLTKGQILHCYLGEERKRPIMVVYLDGKNRDGNKKQ